ncbi:Thioredoxin domain-containing protein 3 [Clonorchis sinensis]|uniref:Thioredoxin domain-containing protein 3 n=1 Tax=Clonorchis sinensis TaxID=79923 RepID=A0A8T1MYK2_CLOSI|nr:Thioredoxin domain-containing protein 3 [Clonorchis sinensis]
MAKKKVEVALQEEIETQEEWERALQREGLIIIDIYQDWAGPCKAAAGIFRRMKTELNDDLLNFAIAKADTIDSLVKYRGKCEPCFLFFGCGKLVAAIRGVNPPELEKNILEKLKQEHEVLRGEAERVEIRDPVFLAQELAEEEERRRKEEEEVPQEVTIAVLKPDIVQSGRTDELIAELEGKGISVIRRISYTFTKEEAEEFYVKLKGEPYYKSLVDFMISGPSEILLCAKGAEGVIEDLKGLVGPAISEASEKEPGLRAKYASDKIRNAIHAPDSKDEAARELAFFFPDFEPPIVTVRRPRVQVTEDDIGERQLSALSSGFGEGIQRTVALLRPKAYSMYKDSILEKIKEAGFVVASQKEVTLSKEQAEDYYKEHRGETYFGELTTMMSSGPCLALLLARQDAVDTWRKLLGPKDVAEAKATAPESLRAQYVSEDKEDMADGKSINLIHGSASVEEAQHDIERFFPVERTLAAVKPDAYANRDEIIEMIKSAGFHVAARKDTQLDEKMAAQLYENVKDKPFFDDLVRQMTSGRTLFMVLTREDAIAGWRQLMGPTDPDKAADEVPASSQTTEPSIRAAFGRSILENAVHGSSSAEQASATIQLIFGDPSIGMPEKSGKEPASEPSQEPAAESKSEPAAEPASETAVEPASEPAAEPALEPAPTEDKHEEEGIVEEVLENTDQVEPAAEVSPEEVPKEEPEIALPPEASEPPVAEAAAEPPPTSDVVAPETTAEVPVDEQNQSAVVRILSQTSGKSDRGDKKSSISKLLTSKSISRSQGDADSKEKTKRKSTNAKSVSRNP